MALKKELIKNNLLILASSIISVIIAFVSSIVIARLLGPFSFGLYSFALTVVGFFSIFTTWGISLTVIRFLSNYLSRNRKNEANTVIRTGFKFRFLTVLTVGLFLIAFSDSISVNIFNKPDVVFLIFLAGTILILDSLTDFFLGVLIGLKKFKYLAITKIFDKSLKFGFALTLILLGFSYIGAIAGIIIASAIILLFSIFLISRNRDILGSPKGKINNRDFYVFCLWAFIGGLGAILFNSIDSFMISIFLGIEDIGFYKIAFTWSFAIVTVFPISWIVLSPYFSSSKRNEIDAVFHNSFRYGLIIVIPLAFILSAYAAPIISLFYGVDFLSASGPLIILSLATIPLILSSFFTSYLTGIKRPDIATKITTFAVTVNIILNYIFILSFGIVGVAVATLISRLLESGAFLLVIRSRLPIKSSLIFKPVIAGLITYYATTFFTVTSILELAAYGIVSLCIYLIVMWLTKGITMKDMEVIKSLYAK